MRERRQRGRWQWHPAAAALLGVGLILFLLSALGGVNLPGRVAAVWPAVLSFLTNRERQAARLPQLQDNLLLDRAAKLKAEDMATRGYFAHVSPEGRAPWYWLDLVGYHYDYAGENLALDFSESREVTTAWMNSPTHRANIVKPAYTEMGSGVATGTYEGRERVFVVQLYAHPADGR